MKALGGDKGVMPNVRGAAFETGEAIGKIETPASHEAQIEALSANIVNPGVEVAEPPSQGFRVVAAEAVDVVDAQARRTCEHGNARGRRQHAAGEDVLLDEVA